MPAMLEHSGVEHSLCDEKDTGHDVEYFSEILFRIVPYLNSCPNALALFD